MNYNIGAQSQSALLTPDLKEPAIAPKGFPLAMASAGERVIIAQLKGSDTNKQRLIGMGLLPGIEIQIVSNQAGAIVVAIAESRLGLGAGMAQKIIVTPID